MNWLGEEEQEREATPLPDGFFVLDGRADLKAIVGRALDASGAERPRAGGRRENDSPLPRSGENTPPIPDDDLEAGIHWGPPSKPRGQPMRWSRPWFAWRNDPEIARKV